ncbi:MAG: ATP synthase F1 subunit delta, partial [Planctomycetota bacterium]
ALIDIGEETGTLDRIYDDLTALVELYREHRDFRALFTSPRIDPDRKAAILRKVLGDELCKPVMGLLHVMVRKGREPLLDNVADQFARFKDLAEGKVHVHIESARPLAEDQRESIRRLAEEFSKRAVIVHERVEPELVGGTIVRMGDFVIDGSLRRRLQALRKSLVAKEKLFD